MSNDSDLDADAVVPGREAFDRLLGVGRGAHDPHLVPEPARGGGRGRVSQLPAVDDLRVPDREDTGPSLREGPFRGSPVEDALTSAIPVVPVSSPVPIVPPAPDPASPEQQAKPTSRKVARIGALTAAVTVGVGAGVLLLVGQVRPDSGISDQAREQAILAIEEQHWIAERADAARAAEAAATRDRVYAESSAQLLSAAELLGATDGRVNESATREQLQAAIAALQESLESDGPVQWRARSAALAEQMQAVTESASAWEQAEAQRVADAAAKAASEAQADAAAQASGGGRKSTSGTGSSGGSPSGGSGAAADPGTSTGQGTGAGGGSTSKRIDPGSISSGAGWVQASATTSGISGPVYLNVGGQSVRIGTGSGTFSGRITGLAPGTYSWSITADGLTANGTKQIEVY